MSRRVTVSLVSLGLLLGFGTIAVHQILRATAPVSGVTPPAGPSPHPLDPLTREEITAAVAALKQHREMPEDGVFPVLTIQEPPKSGLWTYKPGDMFSRWAFAVVFDRKRGRTFEAVVDLRERVVVSWKEMSGVQPGLFREEAVTMRAAVRADPRWQKAMKDRGIENLDDVYIDTWTAGYYGNEDGGDRIVPAVFYLKGTAVNSFGRPIEGVVTFYNATQNRIERFTDTGVVPVSKDPADLGRAAIRARRASLLPLDVSQPRGVSFKLRGNEVRWQNWAFRFSLHPREGLVLHTVSYEDGGRSRPVLYRGSVSEVVVFYGDPSPAWYFRNIFDMGELGGLGRDADPLERLTDAPANAVYRGAVLADDRGNPLDFPRAVAVYERDGGLLWKHSDTDGSKARNVSRRARQLVVSNIASVGNYEYVFNWIFHQDATLEFEVQLTGIMATKGVTRAADMHGRPADAPHGHLVAPHLEGVHHQHFLNVRLDLDVDGADGNSVVEVDTVPTESGPENPYKTAMSLQETVLRKEGEAQRSLNLASSRRWKVINPSRTNSLGQPVGYMLIPGENAAPCAAADSWVRKRAGFVNAHLWATRYDPAEKYAAGDYPNQSRGGDGLPRFVGADRALEGQDVVLWYTLGVTHTPRPEEWPVMPTHRAGFKLVPCGFFSRNPALDVPKPR
jgi:primary-amine oxidase